MYLEISGDTGENTGFPTAYGTNVEVSLLVIKVSDNLQGLKDIQTPTQQIAGFQIAKVCKFMFLNEWEWSYFPYNNITFINLHLLYFIDWKKRASLRVIGTGH